MFQKPLSQIFTKNAFLNALNEISTKSHGIDEVDFIDFAKNRHQNIQTLLQDLTKGTYTPEPIKSISIAKPNSNERRPIGLGAIKDKLVQKVLSSELNEYFNKHFSSSSYAYRTKKSTLKAINRTSDYIKAKYHWVLKSDIDDFFGSINHDKLLQILDHHISDKSIIKLISLFVQNGGFKRFEYQDHEQGVHQGDILSPLLSNVYLDLLDKYLEKQNIPFVRYADDFIILFKDELTAHKFKNTLQNFLSALDLRLEEKKTSIVHVGQGFTFLGTRFVNKNRFMDNERLHKKISKLHEKSKSNLTFKTFVDEINTFLQTLKYYYLKIIQKNSTQWQLLQENFIQALAHKIYLEKQNGRIKTKKEFKNFLLGINFELLFEQKQIKDKINLCIAIAYEKYLCNKSYKDSKAKLNKKKNIYAKKFSQDTTLHVNSPGLNIGIAKNTFSIKEYGKVKKKVPISKVKRIILEGKGIYFSTNLIKRCAKENIPIDFIDFKMLSYASLITYKASTTQMIHKQSLILGTPLELYLAKSFIKGKAKNQLNFLKYLNKYHESLDYHIDKMGRNIKLIKSSSNKEQLLGYEGNISALYWEGIRTILKVEFEKRITFGARDLVNTSLNYAYALLYGCVQHSLVNAGLSLNISYLHALDKQKPTLTFDMIEEFRTFMVDRVVVSMLNKDEPLKLGRDGLLSTSSKQLLAKNIKEKLGSYTMWKKSSTQCQNIIQTQAYNLARCINEGKENYKPFIGKY